MRLFDLRDGSEAGQFAAAEDTGALHVHVHAPGHACMKGAQPRWCWSGHMRPPRCLHPRCLFHPCNLHPLAVNGVAFHPFLPLLATASGQRRYFLAPCDDSSSSGSESDSEDSSMAAAGGSSGESDSEEGSGGGHASAAAAAGMRLSARENVLQVWHCAARTLELPNAPAADTAAGEGGEEEEVQAAAEVDELMADGPAEAAAVAAGAAAEEMEGDA